MLVNRTLRCEKVWIASIKRNQITNNNCSSRISSIVVIIIIDVSAHYNVYFMLTRLFDRLIMFGAKKYKEEDTSDLINASNPQSKILSTCEQMT